VAQKQNIDWSAPSAQAYHTALSAKALDDTSTIATGVSLFTPLGILTKGLHYYSLGSSMTSGYLKDDLLNTSVSEASSYLYGKGLEEKFGKGLGGHINSGLSLIGVHESIGGFVSDTYKIISKEPNKNVEESDNGDDK
jgi:hypothetical protein